MKSVFLGTVAGLVAMFLVCPEVVSARKHRFGHKANKHKKYHKKDKRKHKTGHKAPKPILPVAEVLSEENSTVVDQIPVDNNVVPGNTTIVDQGVTVLGNQTVFVDNANITATNTSMATSEVMNATNPVLDGSNSTSDLNATTLEPGNTTSSATAAGSCSQQCFQLKMHWEAAYLWQESKDEAFWCAQPIGDDQRCADNEPTCLQDITLYIKDCRDTREYENQLWTRVGNTFRPCNDDTKCWTREAVRIIRLRDCNGSIEQEFDGFNDTGSPFAITHQRKPGFRVSQNHHPKSNEVLRLGSDDSARRAHTGLWDTVPGPFPKGCL